MFRVFEGGWGVTKNEFTKIRHMQLEIKLLKIINENNIIKVIKVRIL
jgi:hypothetical protein